MMVRAQFAIAHSIVFLSLYPPRLTPMCTPATFCRPRGEPVVLMALFNRGNVSAPWEMASAGIELAGVIVVLALLGWWLDSKWGCSPWLLISGTFIGGGGGTYNLWRAGRRIFKK